jgi:hypothetical protein
MVWIHSSQTTFIRKIVEHLKNRKPNERAPPRERVAIELHTLTAILTRNAREITTIRVSTSSFRHATFTEHALELDSTGPTAYLVLANSTEGLLRDENSRGPAARSDSKSLICIELSSSSTVFLHATSSVHLVRARAANSDGRYVFAAELPRSIVESHHIVTSLMGFSEDSPNRLLVPWPHGRHNGLFHSSSSLKGGP